MAQFQPLTTDISIKTKAITATQRLVTHKPRSHSPQPRSPPPIIPLQKKSKPHNHTPPHHFDPTHHPNNPNRPSRTRPYIPPVASSSTPTRRIQKVNPQGRSTRKKNDAGRTRTCAPEGTSFLGLRDNHSATAPYQSPFWCFEQLGNQLNALCPNRTSDLIICGLESHTSDTLYH